MTTGIAESIGEKYNTALNREIRNIQAKRSLAVGFYIGWVFYVCALTKHLRYPRL